MQSPTLCCLLFFFNDTATTEIYTLSLHDALPISMSQSVRHLLEIRFNGDPGATEAQDRSEEHTSELQSRGHLVCRLLLEKKKWHAQDGPVDTRSHRREERIVLREASPEGATGAPT